MPQPCSTDVVYVRNDSHRTLLLSNRPRVDVFIAARSVTAVPREVWERESTSVTVTALMSDGLLCVVSDATVPLGPAPDIYRPRGYDDASSERGDDSPDETPQEGPKRSIRLPSGEIYTWEPWDGSPGYDPSRPDKW